MTTIAPLTLGQATVMDVFRRLAPEQHAERNLVRVLELPSASAADGVRDVLRLLVERHESLRTRFDVSGAKWLQIIDSPAADLPIEERHIDNPDDIGAALPEFRNRQFDLSRQHGWHGVLLLDERNVPHHLAICLHHAVIDWFGLDQLEREFATLLQPDQHSRQEVLDGPLLRPRDLASTQRSATWRDRKRRSMRHWAEVLDEVGHMPSPAKRTTDRIDISLRSVSMWHSLQAVARRCQVSAQSVLLALTAMVVASVANTTVPVLYFPVANRYDRHWRPIVAPMVQSKLLPVRIDPTKQAFDEFACAVHQRALACMRHGFYDPEELTALLSERGLSSPVPDYQFNLLPYKRRIRHQAPPLEQLVSHEPRYRTGPRLRIWALTEDSLWMIVRADRSLVSEPTVRRILCWFREELAQLAEEPSRVQDMLGRLAGGSHYAGD